MHPPSAERSAADVRSPARSQSLEAAIERLFDRVNYEKIAPGKYQLADFRLTRMERLLELLGDPHRALPCVHIAGTKGKGSTASMVASVLTTAGHQTGLFTSPHIHHFEERVRVNMQFPDPGALEDAFAEIWRAVDALDAEGQHATYFEISTALAWTLFRHVSCDIAVMEVGLGGRLDSTNLCQPLVTAITSISRDHSKLLGDTPALIAAEKAGIFKAGVPAVSGATGEAAETIARIANEVGCPLWTLGEDVSWTTVDAEPLSCRTISVTTPHRLHADLPVVLPGAHQEQNTAIVAAICDFLPEPFQPSDAGLREGLDRVRCPLRVEVVRTDPWVILDAAHNGASMAALVKAVQPVAHGRRRLIFGTSSDKHVDDMLAELHGFADEIVVAAYSSNPRAIPTSELAGIVEEQLGQPVTVAHSPAAAMEALLEDARADDVIIATGSFFLAGEIREHLLADRTAPRSTAGAVS